MPEPQNKSESAGLLDVVILSFAPRDEPAEVGLQRVFGIDPEAAAKLVQAIPRTVQRAVNRVRAEYFRKALELIGAQVEVRDEQGRVVPPLTLGEAVTLRPPRKKEAEAPRAPNTETSAAAPHIDEYFAPPVPPVPPVPRAAMLAETSTPVAMPDAKFVTELGALAEQAGSSVRGPAHPTLKEGVPALSTVERAQALEERTTPASAERLVVAPYSSDLPDSAFRFGNTNPPFIPSTSPAHARTVAAHIVAPGPNPMAERAQDPPLSAADADGGMIWGDIDRIVGAPAPARLPGIAPATAISGPAPIELPAGQPAAVRAAVVAGAKPAAFAIFESIPVAEPWRAPSQKQVAAERRKRAILAGDAALSVPDAVAPEMPMLGRWEQPEPESLTEPKQPKPLPVGRADALFSAPPSAAQGEEPSARPSAGRPGQAALTAPQHRASDQSESVEPVAQASLEKVDSRSFWETIPEALGFPAAGRGAQWLSAIALFALVTGVVIAVLGSIPVVGFVIGCTVFTALLAICGDYHRACFWAVTGGESGLSHGPNLDLTRVLQVYLRSGVNLFGFLLLSHVPLLLWVLRHAVGSRAGLTFALVASPAFWELSALSAWYWPMALTTASVHNDFLGVWDVALGLRAILRVPLHYGVIALLGGGCFVAVWAVFLAIGLAAHLPAFFFTATLGIPLALSHGLLGALSGHLVRTHPHAFE